MIYIWLNIVPILAATAAGLLVGLAWRLLLPGAPADTRLALTAVLAELWLAAILAGALILAPVEAGGWTVALGTAVIIWGGFVLPVLLVTHVHRGLGLAAGVTDGLHWLLVMLAMAAVLRILGLAPPPA
jgi:hypothetical protein